MTKPKPPGKGHNAGPVVADRLKSFVERIERMIEEREAINADIKDIYTEAKGVGYDVKTMRKVVSLRAMDAADRAEQEALLDTYMHALGMVDRIDARLAAGERPAAVAAAEGVSRATAYRASQKRREEPKVENETPADADGVVIETVLPGGALVAAESERPAPAPAITADVTTDRDVRQDRTTESCGAAVVPSGKGLRIGIDPPNVPAQGDQRPAVRCGSDETDPLKAAERSNTPVVPQDLLPDARNMVEASPTPEMGAVGSDSDRVAEPSDDDLTTPAFLRGPSRQRAAA